MPRRGIIASITVKSGKQTDAGIRPDHIMAYMLIGYRHGETDVDIFHRIERMRTRGIRPYPMV